MAINMKPGDWMCAACGNHNFASRQACKQCQGPRTDGQTAGAYGAAKTAGAGHGSSPYGDRPPKEVEVKEGDWMCQECSFHNFASRVNCNKCNALREGMKQGDWVCRGCKNHNFARNMMCKKCQSPRMMQGAGGKGGGMGGMEGMMMMMMQQAFMAGKAGQSFPMAGAGGCSG
eukprot:CAMPEP_0177323092 /NCGR_PEP_ID=MMETSP0368-20130122/16558_1 /TAXON_ID=447022 ORGANISM="Scrippsiella hangoei-like, Strain SHHI-4" /NCGR_SAMPLE_ID=MMETSP0368 /ASSEMBLY_ACC=CAM_ASM_000363 /LENGTH=172 /DNA_ID=CAMNT_0018782835 /DNA_START=68 /DNA_END=583 /DNA_ORIENTATION=-